MKHFQIISVTAEIFHTFKSFIDHVKIIRCNIEPVPKTTTIKKNFSHTIIFYLTTIHNLHSVLYKIPFQ